MIVRKLFKLWLPFNYCLVAHKCIPKSNVEYVTQHIKKQKSVALDIQKNQAYVALNTGTTNIFIKLFSIFSYYPYYYMYSLLQYLYICIYKYTKINECLKEGQKDHFLQVVQKGLKTAGYSDRNCFEICYHSRLQKYVLSTLPDYIKSFLNRNKAKNVATGKYIQI